MSRRATVSVRDLRNRGGEVLDDVRRGVSVTVTRDGEPVAELRPIPRPALPAEELVARWQSLPDVDSQRMRADIDSVLDQRI